MNVRPYQPADRDRVMEIYTASIHTLAAGCYSSPQLDAWAPRPPDARRWETRLAGLHTLVAEVESSLAGFASYTTAGYLDFLFTHPDFARRGVASRLYQEVESTMRNLGLPAVAAHVSLAARAFFDRHGFDLEAEEQIECRGVRLRRCAMRKSLHRI